MKRNRKACLSIPALAIKIILLCCSSEQALLPSNAWLLFGEVFQFSPALPTRSVGQDLWGRGVTADLPALHLLPVGVVYTTACEPSGLFYPSEAQGTVPASEIQAEAQLLTSPRACHLLARCGIVRYALLWAPGTSSYRTVRPSDSPRRGFAVPPGIPVAIA